MLKVQFSFTESDFKVGKMLNIFSMEYSFLIQLEFLFISYQNLGIGALFTLELDEIKKYLGLPFLQNRISVSYKSYKTCRQRVDLLISLSISASRRVQNNYQSSVNDVCCLQKRQILEAMIDKDFSEPNTSCVFNIIQWLPAL